MDTNCDGTVDWDEYLTYMLLECREKDSMSMQAQRPFPKELRNIKDVPHRDSIIRIALLPKVTKDKDEDTFDWSMGRFATVSKEGLLCFWGFRMNLLSTFQIESPCVTTKSIWITDMVVMTSANMVALCTTARNMILYDITANRFNRLSYITGLNACTTAMHYSGSLPSSLTPVTMSSNNTYLSWGDDKGGISVIIFEKPPQFTPLHTIHCKTERRRFVIDEIITGQLADLRGHYIPLVHADLVRQVRYCPEISCFISCCKDSETAMFLGDFEHKVYKSYFKVTKGINSFDFCKQLNMIVTGGYDAIVRVWNPYVPIKPVILLQGHQSPILHVILNLRREYVISIADNKEVRIHDLNAQTCIQTFYRKMMPGLGPRSITSALYNEAKNALVLGTTSLAVLEHCEDDQRSKPITSHSSTIISALYNPLFNQVVTACIDSLVIVWDFYTGQRVMQFIAYRVQKDGRTIDLEITAMTFDPTFRRLFTASRNGLVKIWNFNNGAMLRELPLYDSTVITAIVCAKQRIVTGGWNKRLTIYRDSVDDNTTHWLLPSHAEDILSVAFYPPNILASSSYDGDILVWSLDTGRLLFCLNTRDSHKPQTIISSTSSGFYSTDCDDKKVKLLKQVVVPPASSRRGSRVQLEESEQQQTSGQKLGMLQETVECVDIDGMTGKQQGTTDKLADRNRNQTHKSSKTPNDTRRKKKHGGAVEKILFLATRENNPETAPLIASYADGTVRAWTIHHNGHLLGEFCAAFKPGEAVNTMATDANNIFLATADSLGYIRVWNITHFCTSHSDNNYDEQLDPCHFPFLSWVNRLEHIKSPCWVNTHAQDHSHPPLLTSFRGHLRSVTSIDIAKADLDYFIITSSPDCSIRLWTIGGTFIGIFGQKSFWNPPDEFGVVHDMDKSVQESWRTTLRGDVLLPPDIRRVASATTLSVFFGDRHALWVISKNVILWLNSSKTMTVDRMRARKKISLHKLKSSKSLTVILPDEEAPTPEIAQASSSILGKSYKRSTRHHALPILPKITHTSNKVTYKHTLLCSTNIMFSGKLPLLDNNNY